MTKTCFFRHCSTDKKCSMFSAPKDPDLFNKWKKSIPGGQNFKKSHYLCTKHFKEEDVDDHYKIFLGDGTIIKHKKATIKLKKNAVPCIFEDCLNIVKVRKIGKRKGKNGKRKALKSQRGSKRKCFCEDNVPESENHQTDNEDFTDKQESDTEHITVTPDIVASSGDFIEQTDVTLFGSGSATNSVLNVASSMQSDSQPSSNSEIIIPDSSSSKTPISPQHPAPFPAMIPYNLNPQWRELPPKPCLRHFDDGQGEGQGICLKWNMELNSNHEKIVSYQLFAYKETDKPITASLWKCVGNIPALTLPMACSLTEFVSGNRYHFTIQAVDVHGRCGPFSDPVSVSYTEN